ncbi:S-adenosyl-L-methionine-dependent methyltransferase [Protomyces lactucae-debilis]|uniref:S-adenosyl-L-methionine-dependent methyltransferase n=1 Tax=Protomyces lactucae-debilis TaxID=2754530 RepID=A0A1Y2EU50_PROLT|nr:S-adenosyl-L-methionine-dependent methyltransferase [Protomyces lactucae-debilis]ORY75101.1 S-adenosyl-L-methionine-dependent methyltransferase [Protomyces lactucae-debilis]
MDKVHQVSQDSFNRNAVLYDKARPSYSPTAINVLISGLCLKQGSKVLDLACGTGKFTRLLDNRGYDLTAADPSTGMLDVLSALSPHIPVVTAGAYSLPFPDAHFDAVAIAQAFHWFADHDALTEISRVLKPGGMLGMIWNLEREGISQLQDEHFAAVTRYDEGLPQYRKGLWKKPLEETTLLSKYQEYVEETTQVLSEEALWERAKSKSFITKLPEEEQQALKRELEEMVRAHPEQERDAEGRLVLPYFVRVIWMKKL